MEKQTKVHLVMLLVAIGFFLIGLFSIVARGACDSAGCMLDKQIAKENQIKKLQEELKVITRTKETLYVSGINDGLKQTSGFTKLPQEQKLGAEGSTLTLSGK